MIGFLSIDYDECNQKSYKKLTLRLNEINKEEIIIKFNSKNFIKDWYSYIDYIIKNQVLYCNYSSTIDHFIMDGDLYESRCLLYNEKDEKYYLTEDYKENLFEIFIPKDSNINFDEWRKYCNEEH